MVVATLPMAAAPAPQELLTVREAAAVLRVGQTFLYGLLGSGKLRFVKLGRATRIRRSDLDEFVSSSVVGGESGAHEAE